MNGKYIIFIGGYLAAGKSTFSSWLSKQLGVLCINKDYVKELLCDRIGFKDRAENKRFSEVTFDIMKHIAEQSMKAGVPIILESNFRQADGDELVPLFQNYDYTPITIMLTGDLHILFQRFNKRLKNRHPAHTSVDMSFEDFCHHSAELATFDVGGKKIIVDTTNFDNIKFDDILLQIKNLGGTK